MANCKSCGALLRGGARFCSQCGAAAENIFCHRCGAELETGDRFCYRCGAAVEQAAPVPAAEAAANENEYPAWHAFAALWDVRSMLSVGAGSPEGHYLSSEYGDKLFRVSEDGVQAEWIELPEGVLAFCGKLWKSGRLWLSALMNGEDGSGRLHRIYTYTPAEGFRVALDVSDMERGGLEIVRFIVTERKIFAYCYGAQRGKNRVSLMACGHDGAGLRELWAGDDFILRGAGGDALYMVCDGSGQGRRELLVYADGTAKDAAEVYGRQLKAAAAEMGVEFGDTAMEQGDFCWKYVPFIDFSKGVIYTALDEGGTENLTRQVYSVDIASGEVKKYGERWQLGDIDPTETFCEYFDGDRAVGFSYSESNCWTALHADGTRVMLSSGNYWDGGAVLGDHFYLDCRSSEPGAWYKIGLRDGSRRKIEFPG